MCHGIAEDVARTLNRDLLEADAPAWQTGVRIVYVPVTAEERLPKVVSGAIDLECGSTTANAERAEDRGVLAGVLPGGHQADGAAAPRTAGAGSRPITTLPGARSWPSARAPRTPM